MSAAEVLSTTGATTLVPACAPACFGAVRDVLAALWPGAVAELQAEPPHLLVHSVAAEPAGEPDVWLTWRLEPVGSRATRVQLLLCEQHAAAPSPQLDEVLLVLLARCLPAVRP